MLPPDTTGIELSPDEVARFARHLILPEVGMEGQVLQALSRIRLALP